MELSGDIVIGAPRAKVWAGLNDAAVLARCIRGCESMEVLSPTERAARVMVKVGPVRARFDGTIRMDQIRPGEGCALSFEGSGGAAGMAKGRSNVELSDEGEGTRLRYTVQASVGGKLGQVGGRMMDAAAKQMADQFFTAFNEHLAPAPAAEPALVEAASTPAAPPMEPVAAASTPAPSPAPSPTVVVRAPTVATPAPTGESVRVLWFALGALSTGFGVWIASLLRSS